MIHNFLTSSAIALRRSDVAVPKHDEAIILRHPSTSRPDGPEPQFVLIVAFFLLALCQCHHKELDAFFVLVPTPVRRCLLHQDVLPLIIEKFYLSEVKYHRSYYWLIS